MSGLDGQLIEQYTSGIFAPSEGQDGYLAIATVTATTRNLRYIDPGVALLGPKLGPDLTDANATLLVSDGNARILRTGTLTANRTLTLSPTGATLWVAIRISRLDVSGYTLAVGALYTFPASVAREAVFVYNGSAWQLSEHWATEA